MRPIYLTFPDAKSWDKLSAEDKYSALTPVVIGTLYVPDAMSGKETISDPVAKPGFHVNMLGELPDELAEYEVFPVTPSCVYGGWSPEEIEAAKPKPMDMKKEIP